MRIASVLVASSLAWVVAADDKPAAADRGEPSVRAYALNVNNPPKEAPKEIVSPAYAGVYLLIQVPGKQIVAIDSAATKLALTDDKGTDLVAPNSLGNSSLATDKSKEQGRLYVLGSKAPAAGATRVRVKGELVLLCGTGEKTAMAEKFAVRDKEKVSVGPAAFEVVTVKDKLTVTLNTETASVKSVTFTDADGKSLMAGGTINLKAAGGKVSQTASFTLPEPEKHYPYEMANISAIWHINDHWTLSPGVLFGLDGREETPQYEAGVFLLHE